MANGAARLPAEPPFRLCDGPVCLRRQERDTSWARLLRPDVAEPFRGGLKYLRQTNDSLFTRENAEQPGDDLPLDRLLPRLDSPSPSVRIHALWKLAEQQESAPRIVPRIMPCLDDRDLDVRIHAASTLAAFGPAAAPAAEKIAAMLHAYQEEVRKNAAYALGQIRAEPERIVPEQTRALADHELPVVKAAAWSLGQYGPPARTALKPLLAGYERFLKRTDDGIDAFAQAIAHVAADPLAEVDAYFAAKGARELHRFAIAELEAAMQERDDGIAGAADL